MAKAGDSGTKIAEVLGCSRSAVLGKIHRGKGKHGHLKGDPGKRRSDKVAKVAPKLRPAAPKIVKAVDPDVHALTQEPVQPPAPVEPIADPVSFMTAIANQGCRFYASDWLDADGPDMLVCGQPVANKDTVPGDRARTHCPYHLRLASNGVPSRRRAA